MRGELFGSVVAMSFAERSPEVRMTPGDLQQRLRGVLAFTPTPFAADGRLDVDGLAAHVDYLVQSGAHVVVVCGGAGEFFSLDMDEYRTAMRTAAEAAHGRVPVVAGMGHATRVASRLAEYAAAAGVDGLMINPQYFVEAPDENRTQLPLPGEILYWSAHDTSVTGEGKLVAEICLMYGRGVTLRGAEGIPSHASLFARIPGDWKYDWTAFRDACRRVRTHKPAPLRIERVEGARP